MVLAGADEHGDQPVFDVDFTGPALLLVGNETAGLSSAWRDLCDLTVAIPMAGAASSLNAANAATAVLYEIARQRALARRDQPPLSRGAPNRSRTIMETPAADQNGGESATNRNRECGGMGGAGHGTGRG
jgi:hypothetical protein